MKKITLSIILLFLFLPLISLARENVDYWYIEEFETKIKVKEDSTAEITEEIIADCGIAKGKHGIFRILPTELKTDKKIYKTPVKLISITDLNGKPLKYKTIKEKGTITWKIGDPNITVKGINKYRIKYEVGNVIRTQNTNFDEFYWNLLGPFWDLEIDNFKAEIIFPEGINKENTKIEYYTGFLGEKDKSLANYSWLDNNKLQIKTNKSLAKKQGITLSAAFPKGLFKPYEFSFWQKYGKFFWLIIPFFVIILCFYLWKLFGKDFEVNKAITPEFEIPENLPPTEMGLLYKNGSFKPQFITAAIINMAVKGVIKIKEVKRKILFFKSKDYELIRTGKEPTDEYERIITEKIFENKENIFVSDFKRRSYREKMKDLKKEITDTFYKKGLVTKKSRVFFIIFLVSGIVLLAISFIFLSLLGIGQLSLAFSGLILLFFSIFMPKRTKKGAELFWRIKGFKMYMKTAEKYRQQFYEKENIFDKLLPYAIVFGMVKQWAKKMEKIYGEDYYRTHYPLWYLGGTGRFDVNSFVSTINSISSSISSNVSSGSGSGGAGGVGGGGGGGGGGGW